MEKSEVYKTTIKSLIHDEDMPDDTKVDVLAVLFSDMGTAEYMERKEIDDALSKF